MAGSNTHAGLIRLLRSVHSRHLWSTAAEGNVRQAGSHYTSMALFAQKTPNLRLGYPPVSLCHVPLTILAGGVNGIQHICFVSGSLARVDS
jgi:hypothetical protein